MPDWVGWTGLVLSILFGALNVWQLIQYLVDRKVRDATKKHIRAMKGSVQALRQMCVESIATEEVIKAEAVRQWVRQVGWYLLGIEQHIDALLEPQELTDLQKGNIRLRNVLNDLIVSGNEVIQRVKDDPGLKTVPELENDPSPEVRTAVDEWVSGARSVIDRERHDFLGRFDDVHEFQTMNWVMDSKRSREFNDLIEKVAARIKRLGELQSQT
jgi:hypothetical protein